MPALPTVLPGLALSQAISSFRSFAGDGLGRDDDERRDHQQRHRLEIGQQVVGQVAVGCAGDDVRAVLAEADGVAVGRRAHRAADADGAARAGDVLDDDGLAERDPHPLGEDAADHVGRSAGRERHDHGDGLGRIGLRKRGHAMRRPARRRPRRDAEIDGVEIPSQSLPARLVARSNAGLRQSLTRRSASLCKSRRRPGAAIIRSGYWPTARRRPISPPRS